MDHKDTREDLRGTDMEALGFTRAPVEGQLCLCISATRYGRSRRTLTDCENVRSSCAISRILKICEYVRITIGTPEAMDALVEATKEDTGADRAHAAQKEIGT